MTVIKIIKKNQKLKKKLQKLFGHKKVIKKLQKRKKRSLTKLSAPFEILHEAFGKLERSRTF